MSNSTPPPELILEPAPDNDDPRMSGEWVVKLLDSFCRVWAAWRTTWTWHRIPAWSPGNLNAYLVLEREPRIVTYRHELITGEPPPGLDRTPALLQQVSKAVQQFGGRNEWRFQSHEQVDEVARGLLTLADSIADKSFKLIPESTPTELARAIQLALHREKPKGAPASKETASRKAPARRGRRPDTDPREDQRIATAWGTGCYKTFADLDREMKLPQYTAKRAVDRHRKRQAKRK